MRQESWQTANYCFFWSCRSTSACPKNSCRIRQAMCNAIIKKIDDWGLRGANTGRLNGACALLEAKLWQWCIVFGMPSPHAWDYFWEVFPLVWHLPQLQGSKFWRGLRKSGQMLCTVTSVPGPETILYSLNWILKLMRWSLSCAFEQLDMKHLRDDYWDEFCSSQHFGDMLRIYYHQVLIFAFSILYAIN